MFFYSKVNYYRYYDKSILMCIEKNNQDVTVNAIFKDKED